MNPIIEVQQVSKEFRLGQLQSLKQGLGKAWARLLGRAVAERAPFKALDEINISVAPGEVLGIIGHNGAGKSTLLKLLAGISAPTRGRIAVHGQVAPLIEVGAGLVADLTGRENIFLNATILGMKKAEIERKFDEIVAFAELEEFIDTPVKRYSSGMQVRLGFAIATSVDAEVLIVDEVLAVGDIAFQRKCFDRMEAIIKDSGKTVLLVSHNIRQVERLCTRAILLEHGRIAAEGNPVEVCDRFYQASERHATLKAAEQKAARHESSGDVELLSVGLLSEQGIPIETVTHGQAVTIRVVYDVKHRLPKPVFGVGLHTPDFVYLATAHSDQGLGCEQIESGRHQLDFTMDRFPFLPGVYCIRVGIATGDLYASTFYAERVLSFQVVADAPRWAEAAREGLVPLEGSWRLAALKAASEKQAPNIESRAAESLHSASIELAI